MMSTLFSWVFLGAFVLGAIYCWVYWFRHRGSENWPTVKGKVEAFGRVRSIGADNVGPFYGTISYSYQVEGEYYSGEWDTPSFSTRQQVLEFLERHMPPGSEVLVQYDPRSRQRSILQVDPTLGNPENLTQLKI